MRLKTRIDLAFGGVLAVVLLVAAMSWIGAEGLASTAAQVDQARAVDDALDAVLDDLIDVENGMRGFVIAGTPGFLEPYERGKEALAADLEQLRHALAGSSAYAEELERALEPVIARRLAHAGEVIERRRAEGFEAAQALIHEGRGKEQMDQARRLLEELEQADKLRIAELTRTQRQRASLALALVIASTVGMLVLVIAGMVMVRRSIVAPIVALAGAARRAQRGLWPGPASVRADELGDLERSLSEMVDARARAEQHVRDLVDDAPEPFFLADLDGHYVDVNRAACELLGYTRAELLERSIVDLIPAEDVPRLAASRETLGRPGAIDVSDWRLRARSGVLIPVAISAKIFPDGRWQAFARDLRDRQRLDEERQAGLRAREDLIAVVSHDLKNPLNAVELRTRLIERHVSEPRIREHCMAVHRSVATMQRMIRGLLDAASLEAGRLRLELDRHDLGELVGEVLDVLGPVAADTDIELVARAERGHPRRFDRDRIAQVLYNLVGNALKFTPSGGRITVTVEERDTAAVVSVTDTGSGIAAEAIPHIFDRFYTTGGRVGGTGLGLAIAKGLVEAHGGTIEVTSAPGQGSTFAFTLPAAPVSAEGRTA